MRRELHAPNTLSRLSSLLIITRPSPSSFLTFPVPSRPFASLGLFLEHHSARRTHCCLLRTTQKRATAACRCLAISLQTHHIRRDCPAYPEVLVAPSSNHCPRETSPLPSHTHAQPPLLLAPPRILRTVACGRVGHAKHLLSLRCISYVPSAAASRPWPWRLCPALVLLAACLLLLCRQQQQHHHTSAAPLPLGRAWCDAWVDGPAIEAPVHGMP